jgi:hypothetical protein
MKILMLIGFTILYMIGITIFATILALGTMFTCFSLQMLLFGRGDYLLFVSNGLNIIPAIMIMILMIYAFVRIKERFFKRKEGHLLPTVEDVEPAEIETFSNREQSLLKPLNKLEAFDV